MLRALITYGIVFGLGLTAFLIWEPTRIWLGPLLVILGLILLAKLSIEPSLRYTIHRWETTEKAVYSRSGWLVREWRAAPLSRVQTVDAIQGPLEQLFGLATLSITTASSSGSINISGLDYQTAEKIAQELSLVTQAVPGDAT